MKESVEQGKEALSGSVVERSERLCGDLLKLIDSMKIHPIFATSTMDIMTKIVWQRLEDYVEDIRAEIDSILEVLRSREDAEKVATLISRIQDWRNIYAALLCMARIMNAIAVKTEEEITRMGLCERRDKINEKIISEYINNFTKLATIIFKLLSSLKP